jgi:hypothetical protein
VKITRIELEAMGICHYSGDLYEECIDSKQCVCGLTRDGIAEHQAELNADVAEINEIRQEADRGRRAL